MFSDVDIEQLGVSNYFTLNKTSKLVSIIEEELKAIELANAETESIEDIFDFIENSNT